MITAEVNAVVIFASDLRATTEIAVPSGNIVRWLPDGTSMIVIEYRGQDREHFLLDWAGGFWSLRLTATEVLDILPPIKL